MDTGSLEHVTRTPRTLASFPRLKTAAAIAATAALLVGMTVAGCSVGIPGSANPPGHGVSTAAIVSAGPRIVLRFDAEVVTATLTDTAEARQFAAQLPLTLDLRDPMGQAKSGRLPVPIDHPGAESVTDPDAGGIYYVPERAMIAIFYDDLGQTVPPPGLIRLGTVDPGPDSGRDAMAAAGSRMRILIDLADRTSF